MQPPLLVVYNTCGLSGKDNIGQYARSLATISAQDYQNKVVAVSACCVPKAIKNALLREFPYLVYCDIQDVLPVNFTFNYTCWRCTQEIGAFKGYIYVDSGCSFISRNRNIDSSTILRNLFKLCYSKSYALAGTQTNTDNGLARGLRIAASHIIKNQTISLGYYLNSHVVLYTDDLYRAYRSKLVPDVFAGHCSESVQSFICAAIGKKAVLSGSLIVDHVQAVDGPSIAFGGARPSDVLPWDNLFRSHRTMREIIADPEAYACGLGYEEVRGRLLHNPACYDDTGNCLDKERLHRFIDTNLYLSDEASDYTGVNATLDVPDGLKQPASFKL